MKYRFGYLLVTATLFCACDKVAMPPEPSVPQEIKINAFLQEGNHVRPLSTRAVGGDLANGYFLYGAWTTGPFLDATAQANTTYFVKDRLMNIDGTTLDTTKLFWKMDGTTYHSFFAYSANPVNTTKNYGASVIPKNLQFFEETPYGMSIVFKQENNPAKHIDLLVADRMDIQTIEGVPSAVNLYFRHRLSKVSVRVFGSGGLNLTDCQARIKYGYDVLSGISYFDTKMPGMQIIMDEGTFPGINEGSVLSHFSGTYNIGGSFSVPGSAVTEKDAVQIGDLILLPRKYNEKSFELSISYKVDGSNTPVTVTSSLPPLNLNPMMQYVINFNILETTQSLSVSSVQLTDWATTSGTIDQL